MSKLGHPNPLEKLKFPEKLTKKDFNKNPKASFYGLLND
jgi:hypothetical protein